MRILFLSQRVPYPPNRGDKIPNFHYVRHLAREHEVTVACLADGQADLENVAGLSRIVSRIEAVPLSRIGSRVRALGSLVAGDRPLTVASFDEPELRRRIRSLLADGRFDLVLVTSSGMAQFVESVTDTPRIIQFLDLDSEKWRLYAATGRIPGRWIYGTESRRLACYERRIADAFDCAMFCASREMEDFQRRSPATPVRVIRNGVDLNYFTPTAECKDPARLIFTGVMNYWPNVDGVIWFCREILPRIQAKIAGASLTICGASPSRPVRALGRLNGVRVTGAVPDVRPELARASVGICPVRIARGVQNKILEAMAMGLPVVATGAASGGIDLGSTSGLSVADSAAEFSDAVVRLLADSDFRLKAGQGARIAVEENYQWSDSLAQLDEIIRSVCAHRAWNIASAAAASA